jgi:hypothetical protein
VEFSALDLGDLLSFEIVLRQKHCTLVLVEDLLVLLVLVLLSTQLKPVILPNAVNLSLIRQVQAMLEAT